MQTGIGESNQSTRYVRPGHGAPDYVSDQSYTVHSSIPLRYRTTSPAIRFSSVAAGLKERALFFPPSLSLSLSPWPPTGTHRSICYNKTTILAPTRDDSIGRSKADRGLFLRITRVSRSRLRAKQDAPVMVETSSKRYMPPSTAPLLSIGRFHHGNGYEQSELERERKGGERGGKGERGKGQTHTSPPTSYILQHRSGALGEDRAGAKWIWHFEQLRPLSLL